MPKIPPQPPSVGGMTPLSPEEGGKSSSKEIASLRAGEMRTPSKSGPQKRKPTKKSNTFTLKIWGKFDKEMLQGASASIILHLKKAFNQISG